MNCKFINVLMFTAGAAIGSVVTWKFVKNKYDRIVQEEVESVKETYYEMLAIRQNGDDDADVEEVKDEINEEKQHEAVTRINWSDYEDLEDEEDSEEYANLVSNYTNKEGGAVSMGTEPYVISPYDFGELDDYSEIELTYYEGDDTLEDDEGRIVSDREELIGPTALFTFGEYEDDAVFVRNERLRTDFQILKDYRSYAEARSIGPSKVDD